ncbi:MAG TPA: ATP-binding protein [Burkholderiales bacterium]|nr:ATP-binding protein [Burkholderiales bacterium]
MRRLYLRIYLAVLASLAVFALAAGLLWRQLADSAPQNEIAATLAANVLPAATAAPREQQAALEKLAANLRADAALFAADGTPLASVGRPLPAPQRPGWLRGLGGPPAWAVDLGDGRWLVARLSGRHRHPAFGLFLTLALLVVAVGVGAYPVVRRLTARLERLQQGVESFGAGQLDVRVKVEGNDEVARLAESFNRAAMRIEELVGAQKSLLANASHELRTPLTRIRMATELMKEGAEPRRKLELERDIAELDALIDEIMLSSRLDAAERMEKPEALDVLALAAEECARYEQATLEGESVTIQGEPRLLRRMIRNLLENARRHGKPPIQVRVTRNEISICDQGPGVPEAEREKIFEPFYRGLGLSIVRRIARRHGGEATCIGNCFVVSLKP